MVAVGGGDHGGVVVAEVLAEEEGRAVSEDDVVLGEAFLDAGGRRHDDDAAGAEPEGQNGAVFLGQTVKMSVDWDFQEMEVADDGKRRWAWWEVFVSFFGLDEELESY